MRMGYTARIRVYQKLMMRLKRKLFNARKHLPSPVIREETQRCRDHLHGINGKPIQEIGNIIEKTG